MLLLDGWGENPHPFAKDHCVRGAIRKVAHNVRVSIAIGIIRVIAGVGAGTTKLHFPHFVAYRGGIGEFLYGRGFDVLAVLGSGAATPEGAGGGEFPQPAIRENRKAAAIGRMICLETIMG